MAPKRTDYISQNASKIESKTLPIVAYVASFESPKNGGCTRWSVVGFMGQEKRPSLQRTADSYQDAMELIPGWWTYAERIENEKAEKRARNAAARNAPAPEIYVEGAVLYTNWGYDQTNVEWYQVVARKGMTATIRALKCDYTETGFMSGRTAPVVGEFCGEPFRIRITKRGGCERAKTDRAHSHVNLYVWGGKPKHSSSYA